MKSPAAGWQPGAGLPGSTLGRGPFPFFSSFPSPANAVEALCEAGNCP